MPVAAFEHLLVAEPFGGDDFLVQRPVEPFADFAAKQEAQVGIGAVGMRPVTVNALQGLRLELVAGFLQGFAHHRLQQALAGIQVPGRLVVDDLAGDRFAHQQVPAAALAQRRYRGVGFPDVFSHDASFSTSRPVPAR